MARVGQRTVRDGNGIIKVVKRDKEGKPRTSSTYICGDKECGSDATWIYDDHGRLVSVVFEWKPATASQSKSIDTASGPDPIHDYSPDKPESIIGDLGVKPTSSPSPSPAQAPAPKFKLGANYKFDFKLSDGLKTETFTLPSGAKISLNFPGDLSVGDRFTGTLRTELAGSNEKERAKSQAELNKYTLSIGGQPMSVSEGIFSRIIPSTLNTEEPYVVLMENGKQAGSATVPMAQNPPPTPQNTQLPTCGQMGRNVVVTDRCDGIVAPTDSCTIGRAPLQPLAESPRMRVLQNTSNILGATQINYREQGKETNGPFQNFGVALSAGNLSLLRGQQTTLVVTITGLTGIQQDVPLDLINESQAIVNMEGGNAQHFDIHQADVAADGTYKIQRSLTGIQQGAFEITATVMCTPVLPTPTPTPTPTPSPGPAGATPSPGPTPSSSSSPCCPLSPGTYTVTHLGTLPPPASDNDSIATGINDSEDTVGVSWNKYFKIDKFVGPHAFGIYPAGAPLVAKDDLGWPSLPAGGIGSFAYGVNASGHVVGNWFIPPVPLAFTYPFWFDGVKMHNLPTPPYPEGSGQAFAINIDDDVVGVAASGKPSIASVYPDGWAAMWPHDSDPTKDHAMVNLNTLLPPGSGWKLTAAYGINDAKHVVGKGVLKGATHAFLWLGSGDPVDLGTLEGSDFSVAFGLNSSDEVVGYSKVKEAGGFHGFVWKDGVMKDIGKLFPYPNSVAQAINEKGCVVGDIFVPTLYKPIFEGGALAPTSHGALYSDGMLIDVNTLIPADSGWELKTANDINDKCQIVGAGYYKGSKYLTAYLLTPPGVALTRGPKPAVPKPSAPTPEVEYFTKLKVGAPVTFFVPFPSSIPCCNSVSKGPVTHKAYFYLLDEKDKPGANPYGTSISFGFDPAFITMPTDFRIPPGPKYGYFLFTTKKVTAPVTTSIKVKVIANKAKPGTGGEAETTITFTITPVP